MILVTLSVFLIILGGNVKGEVILKTEYQDSAPKYFEKNGKIAGICVDIINELNSRLRKKHIKIGSPEKVVMNPVQSPGYQDTESHPSLLVQDYQKN
ncbi:Uncharacterized protein dnm_011540 [Desulfonema magnum]|uniref:Solute-binding protein family 3/N-terminal domain-containing protein n=2 Tax=Desulfonema magnum TaxID=45655 RepID=A0A975BH74_9BACT|nr:Uncharacterized protein dnm_011540 [Desulfonema magnum]